MDEEKIDFLGPAFIMAAIAALMSDFAFIFLLALPIPIIGLVIALMVIMFHYFAGLIVLFFVFLKLKHLLPKLVLLLSIILPLPFLSIGMVLAIILQNRIIETIVTQAALTAVTVATGGAGAGLQAGVTAARAGAAAAKVAETATEATRAGTLGSRAVTIEKEATLGSERAGGSAAEREVAPKQQEDALEDKLRDKKERLDKILEKVHEKDDREDAKRADEARKKEEEENQL